MHLMSYKIVTWLVATSRRGLKIILGWVLIFAASQRLFTGKCPEKSQWNDPKTTIRQVWNKDSFRYNHLQLDKLSSLLFDWFSTEQRKESPKVKVLLDRRNSRLRLTRDKHLISLERESHRLHWHAQQWSALVVTRRHMRHSYSVHQCLQHAVPALVSGEQAWCCCSSQTRPRHSSGDLDTRH